jgi:TonB family protein
MLAYLLLQLAATEKVAVPPSPPIPVIVMNPVPKGNPGSWVTTNDYPVRSLRTESEGVSSFRLTIGTDGRVTGCQITGSNGDPDLDLATCTNVTRRARFQPALDRQGNPVEGYYSNRVRWQIPLDPSYIKQVEILSTSPQLLGWPEIADSDYPLVSRIQRQGGDVIVAVDVSEMGRVRACAVRESSGFAALDIQSCVLAKRMTNYAPAYDTTGKPIGGKVMLNFTWIPPKRYDESGLPIPEAEPALKPRKVLAN